MKKWYIQRAGQSEGYSILKLRRLLALCCGLALSACAAAPTAPAGAVRVAPDLTLTLPPPASLGRSLEATQLVTAHYGDQTYLFEGHFRADRRHLLLEGLDSMGRKAMTIDWSPEGIHADTAPWLPRQLRPENMLADMVMLYWPPQTVRAALAASGGRLRVEKHRRVISDAKGPVIEARYSGDDPWNGRLVYRNLAWGYRLEIQSVETAP
ncbi:hypothetical protein GALL_80180 [mine drainage metagenome]|uniref:DUF3261 domain-containing protein n=1 Tax=mine drainage metagenome TaxID=410659 RepID=A0A1J5SNN6_9ZZZZ